MLRTSNTDHHVRMLQYKHRFQEAETHFLAGEAKRLTKEAITAKYDKHFEKKIFQGDIQEQEEEVRQYREDLKRQMEYNNEKRRLEKDQLERELAEGLAEEKSRRQHVLQIIQARLDDSCKHPFRSLLEKQCCPCPDDR